MKIGITTQQLRANINKSKVLDSFHVLEDLVPIEEQMEVFQILRRT